MPCRIGDLWGGVLVQKCFHGPSTSLTSPTTTEWQRYMFLRDGTELRSIANILSRPVLLDLNYYEQSSSLEFTKRSFSIFFSKRIGFRISLYFYKLPRITPKIQASSVLLFPLFSLQPFVKGHCRNFFCDSGFPRQKNFMPQNGNGELNSSLSHTGKASYC